MPEEPRSATEQVPREIQIMVDHHEQMQGRLRERVEALAADEMTDDSFHTERDALHDFLSADVIPHALAEEDSVYRFAADIDRLAPLVAGMTMEHHTLLDLARKVDGARTVRVAASAAVAFRSLFEVHVQKENELLLPALVSSGLDPSELLLQMRISFESRQRAAEAEKRDEQTADGSQDLYAAADEVVVDTRVPTAESCADQANQAVDSLVPGGSFLLVADHDPRAIHYMLQAERPGSTTWDLLEDGPQRWQARIGKVAPQPTPAG